MARISEKPVRKSLRAAVDANCKECIHDPADSGTWREQVEQCTSYQCPLFDLRPKSRRKNANGTYPLPEGRSHEIGPVLGA